MYIYIYKYYNNVVHKFIVIFCSRFIFVIFGTCILNGKKGWKTLNIYVKAVFVLSPSDFVLLKTRTFFDFGWADCIFPTFFVVYRLSLCAVKMHQTHYSYILSLFELGSVFRIYLAFCVEITAQNGRR